MQESISDSVNLTEGTANPIEQIIPQCYEPQMCKLVFDLLDRLSLSRTALIEKIWQYQILNA